jgi:hypothetical protein
MQSDRSPRDMCLTAAIQKIAAGWTTVLSIEDSMLKLMLEDNLNDLPRHRIGAPTQPRRAASDAPSHQVVSHNQIRLGYP